MWNQSCRAVIWVHRAYNLPSHHAHACGSCFYICSYNNNYCEQASQLVIHFWCCVWGTRALMQSSQPILCAFSISCEVLQFFGEPLRNSSAEPILRMRSPTPIHKPAPPQCRLLILHVQSCCWRWIGSEGSLQGATEDRSNSWYIDGIVLRIVGPISILRIQRDVIIGNTKESVGSRALLMPLFHHRHSQHPFCSITMHNGCWPCS